ETIDKNDPVYKNALDAHDLAGTFKLVGQEGGFKGTVDQIYEERDGDILILDFDPNYKTAVTAILKNLNFPKFPVVRDLKGKEIVVVRKWIDFQCKAEIELTDPKQIKIMTGVNRN